VISPLSRRSDRTTRTDGIAGRDAIGNTRAMTSMPNPTRYHRWLGWHAPALRRTVIVGSIGLIVAVVLLWFVPWGMAVVAGWDAAALAFLISVWPIIIRADSGNVVQLAKREDENRGSATVLLLGASVASLLGVGFALILAGRQNGAVQVLLVAFAVLTVLLSWTVVNTVFTLRYADQSIGSGDAGIAFGIPKGRRRPRSATSPMSRSRSACAIRYPTPRCAIAGSGEQCFPMLCSRTCLAWR
jgi:hypothetical protein